MYLYMYMCISMLSVICLSQSAGSFDDMQDVATSSPRTQRPSGGGQAGNIRARFEKMASTEQEVRMTYMHVT